ncbi:MAG TPA: ACT domain-containing protein [Bacillales bacterium]|nr:ACT domain-containing protein [Bacillales bacterium]
MNRKKREQFYLVREDVLPEAMEKVLQAKALLDSGKAHTVFEAVQEVGLSRSAFYKYRDSVYPFHKVVKEQIITLFFHLEDHSGTLSKLLAEVASVRCNVLTIHQSIPLQGRANVSLSMDISDISVDIDDLLENLRKLPEVLKVEIIGSGA